MVAFFGVPFGPINTLLPCLILGLGVDDMFVLAQAYDNLEDEEKQLSLEKRVGGTLRHAGSAISVTSFTDFAAFLIGGTSVSTLVHFCGRSAFSTEKSIAFVILP